MNESILIADEEEDNNDRPRILEEWVSCAPVCTLCNSKGN